MLNINLDRIDGDPSNEERTLGGLDVFLPYIRDYVNTFTGKSISAFQWKDHLYDYYKRNNPEKVKLLDRVNWQVRTVGYTYFIVCLTLHGLTGRVGSMAKGRSFPLKWNTILRL